MAKDIISRPLLKTTYIDNQNGDKVLYLEVPEKISRSMVVNEVEGSGKHFESTLKYIDKEYGSIEQYLKSCDISDETLQKIQRKYTLDFI